MTSRGAAAMTDSAPAAGPRIRPAGERALLVELPDLAAVWALELAVSQARSTGAQPWAGVIDVVPGAQTLLLLTDGPVRAGALADALGGVLRGLAPVPAREGPAVVVPVVYDGPDLAAVADLLGLTRDEVVAAHTGTPWRVGFGGFAPGFAYLVDGDPRLQVPRRQAPHTRVPAGAVALAGSYSGIYPRASPGGWQLLGRTDLVLWDVERDPPALLRPGLTVRFAVAR